MSRPLSAICTVLDWASQSLVDLSDAIRSAESAPQADDDIFEALREHVRHEKERADGLSGELHAANLRIGEQRRELDALEARVAELDSAVRHEQLAFAEAQDAAGRTIAELRLEVARFALENSKLREQLARAWKPWPPEGESRQVMTLIGRSVQSGFPGSSYYNCHPSTSNTPGVALYRELTAEEKERANG